MDKNDFDLKNEHRFHNEDDKSTLYLKMKGLLFSQDFAVLCTKDERSAHGSLVAFYINHDLKNIVFATPDYTRKYKLLTHCQEIAIVVDDRAKHLNKISNISAITINGIAAEIEGKKNIDDAKAVLLNKHGYLSELTSSDSCVFFNVEIKRLLYVTHLQEVYEWGLD